MNLHNLYYKDLKKDKQGKVKGYNKYYKLHRESHSTDYLARGTFISRVSQLGRSVGRAISEPYMGRVKKTVKAPRGLKMTHEEIRELYESLEVENKVSFEFFKKRWRYGRPAIEAVSRKGNSLHH